MDGFTDEEFEIAIDPAPIEDVAEKYNVTKWMVTKLRRRASAAGFTRSKNSYIKSPARDEELIQNASEIRGTPTEKEIALSSQQIVSLCQKYKLHPSHVKEFKARAALNGYDVQIDDISNMYEPLEFQRITVRQLPKS